MDQYITGAAIKQIREQKQMTQSDLASALGVSNKAVSKWETAKGYPDITLLEPIAGALGISVIELLGGEKIVNRNVSGNLLKSKLYVCPVCGNVIHSIGSGVISCCGITLPELEAEEENPEHMISCEPVEDEVFVTVDHDMTREHYISFLAYVTLDKFEMKKLYPEGNAEARFKIRGGGALYAYCNRHGLYVKKVPRGFASLINRA